MDIDIPEVKPRSRRLSAATRRRSSPTTSRPSNALFEESDRTIRYGMGENLYGNAEIAPFRAARPRPASRRTLERTVITTYGRDMATAWTLFRRPSLPGKIGRQSQVWVRRPEGWRVVAAHVSVIAEPG